MSCWLGLATYCGERLEAVSAPMDCVQPRSRSNGAAVETAPLRRASCCWVGIVNGMTRLQCWSWTSVRFESKDGVGQRKLHAGGKVNPAEAR